MTTKFDISSLDEASNSKIEKMHKRCEELSEGVQRSTTIKVDYMVDWNEGTECNIIDIGPDIPGIPFNLHWDDMEKLMKELKSEIDEEIKNIIDFSESVADQLGVDKTEFWNQYFLA
jgi:hypothetical protein